jgi:predicted nucleic acid-binding protein
MRIWICRVASIELIAQPVDGNIRIHAVAEDPDDDKYIEAAVGGLAQFVVTGDKHLLSPRSYENIRIVTPRVFLGLL